MRDMFVLYLAAEIKTRLQIQVVAPSVVLPRTTAGNEVRANCTVLVTKLQSVARRKPIIRPRPNGATISSNCVAHEKSVVCGAVAITFVPVVQVAVIRWAALQMIESRVMETRRFGVGRFYVKVKLRKLREMRDVDAGTKRVLGRVHPRYRIIGGI